MRKRRRKQEEVTLNITAMLDMAFQLLAFFAFTFKSPPPEAQIRLKLPPAQQVLGAGAKSAGQDASQDPKEIKPVKSLIVSLLDFDPTTNSGHDGMLRSVSIGVSTTPLKPIQVKDLEGELQDWVQKQGFEQLVLNVSPTLNWQEVMKVVDYCAKLPNKEGKIPSLSFSQATPMDEKTK